MLTLTLAKLATTLELFQYKKSGFKLKQFPGYTKDQWGIKAHNRPWIEDIGEFSNNQQIIEVGGAYSTLPAYLATKYRLDAWVGDDFGKKAGEKIWTRWGDPIQHAKSIKNVKYIFKPFGVFSDKYPSKHFDRIFSVSTLEHIGKNHIIDVFKDMNRCTRPGGMQLHTIDISMATPYKCMIDAITDKYPILNYFRLSLGSELHQWRNNLYNAGIKIGTKFPNSSQLLDRSILVESPDVVYKLYLPENQPKTYFPSASLLLKIEDL